MFQEWYMLTSDDDASYRTSFLLLSYLRGSNWPVC